MDSFHDTVMSTFAERLKAARIAAGFPTAADFAHILGVDEARYRHWERGTTQPTLTMLTRICRSLGKTPDYFLPHALTPPPKKRANAVA